MESISQTRGRRKTRRRWLREFVRCFLSHVSLWSDLPAVPFFVLACISGLAGLRVWWLGGLSWDAGSGQRSEKALFCVCFGEKMMRKRARERTRYTDVERDMYIHISVVSVREKRRPSEGKRGEERQESDRAASNRPEAGRRVSSLQKAELAKKLAKQNQRTASRENSAICCHYCSNSFPFPFPIRISIFVLGAGKHSGLG
ncbi:hypothetical protein EJ06DRAFT_403631 [Trichodelitschia bisporula]|uniref:Transmembrane protein n=1 Tax=Trichodelitschia bisporula TaxID=703511 RepID=A0A6G1HXV0_9PEZI|nr:hypothetical protein EJ06DRAFT_403631 [Trichodelitschia bisporula]